ncbi:MAG TPA: magnesium transporter [Pirellulaceae bacterium]|jgi:magnesium transporter|nr:magnesium transporter [Pirellulaceae bacterium]
MPEKHRPLHEPILDHTRRDFVRVREDQTVAQALESVRGSGAPGRIVYFYVLDAEERLLGVVPTRRLLLSPPDTLVRDVMISDVVVLAENATVRDACELFMRHRLLALPLVGEGNRMLGIVDVEVYTQEVGDLQRHTEAEDVFQLIGVRMSEALNSSLPLAFKSRFPWLMCNVGGGLACAIVSGFFAELLAEAVALAFFVPVVLALAESVSIQSLTLALQASHGRVRRSVALWRIMREFPLGVLLGTACGVLVAIVAWPWKGPEIALCLILSIAISVGFAALFGQLAPTLLRIFRVDPRVASGPMALAATDVVTLTTYLTIGALLLR